MKHKTDGRLSVMIPRELKDEMEQALEVTRLRSKGELVRLMWQRYKSDILALYCIVNTPVSTQVQIVQGHPVQPQQQIQQALTAELPPETEVEQVEDPVITRMAQLIENF